METPSFLNGQSLPPPQGPIKPAKPGRAKNPNNKNPKKTPRRGMGVAQLEQLSREERWKKMADIKSDNHTQYLPISPAVVGEMVPLGGYPVQWNYALGVPMIRGGGGFGSGQGLVYPNGSGAPERMNVLESSKELSSMPNLPHSQTLLLHCCCNNASCYKKKRTNQDSIGDKFNPETNFSMSDGEFLGFSLDNNINGGISGFDATHKLNEGVGVVAVHRTAKGMMGDSTVVMEYDFLLGNNGDRTSKELPRFSIEAGASAASSVVDGGECSYNPVDLSLKLSF